MDGSFACGPAAVTGVIRGCAVRCKFGPAARLAGAVAKFWRLPRVEHAGGICASEPEVADDPERPCREAEAPVEGRFQGSALRGDTDPAGGLLVLALPAQLSRHRGAVRRARSGGRPLHPEPLGCSPTLP